MQTVRLVVAGAAVFINHADGLDSSGDPAQHPASFTRFVLPFQYQLVKCLVPEMAHYSACELSDEVGPVRNGDRDITVAIADRKKYFSVETAHVLHQRAQRFQLLDADVNVGVGRFNISPLNEPNCVVHVRAPELLLFEFDQAAQSGTRSPLALALLIVEVYFEQCFEHAGLRTGAPPISLAGMQQFNELFRYVTPPFARHAEISGNAAVLGRLVRENRGGRSLWQRWLDLPIKTSDGVLRRITPQLDTNPAAPDDINATQLFPFADSRAFVHSCAVVSDVEMLKQHAQQRWTKVCADSGAWIRFLNVDGWRATESASFSDRVTQTASLYEQDWAKPLTFTRWAHFGSLIGYTPHSAAMLGGYCAEPPAWQHFRTMYFDQSCLLIYLRAAMSACSVQLARITLDIAAKKDVTQDLGVFEDQFARLVNLYYQPQISNQQQGIELYKIQRQALGIEAQFTELRIEVEATRHMHASARTMRLTEIAVVLALFATFASTYDAFGVDDILEPYILEPLARGIFGFSGVALLVFLLKYPILWMVKRKY